MSFSVFAFYMIFGGDKIAYDDGGGSAENITVQGYENFNNVLFSMFRLTMVDDYDFDVSIFNYCEIG